MRKQRVALYYYCKTPTGWRHLPAAMNKLKKVRPRYAQVGNEHILYPEGHYELRHYVNRKAVWKNAGEDATEAQRLQEQMMKTLTATKVAEDAGVSIVNDEPNRVHLYDKSREYILRQKTRGKSRHVEQLEFVLPEFLGAAKATFADQLTEAHILRWYDYLQGRGNKPYTVKIKHGAVFGFLKWCGVAIKPLAPNGAPKTTVRRVKVYTPEEIHALLSSLTDAYHRIVFETLLRTGLREEEAVFLEWHNFDFERNTVTVLQKDQQGFLIKDRSERVLPLDMELRTMLLQWKAKNPKSRWVLGNSKGKPNHKWLRMLKRIAKRANLNCNTCAPCLKKDQECERWTLKKFRSTYVTTMLRNNIDPRTIMTWTGHEDLETIMLYMAPAEQREVQDKVNRVVWSRPPAAA